MLDILSLPTSIHKSFLGQLTALVQLSFNNDCLKSSAFWLSQQLLVTQFSVKEHHLFLDSNLAHLLALLPATK